MNIFDLLFILIFLTSIFTLISATVLGIRGKGAVALKILRIWGAAAGAYLGIIVVVSLILPRGVLHVGEERCFDDWCIAVEHVERKPSQANIEYLATLRVFSRARRISQREKDVVVYLTDDRGRRYEPALEKDAVPLDVRLGPLESVETTRKFEVPADAKGVGLVVGHRGRGFPIGWLIIGYETWFRKPTIVRFPG